MDRNANNLSMSYNAEVALRKESVDRNAEDWLNAGSLSVALRKESVDRNSAMQIIIIVADSRSPQGERG